MNSEDRLKEAIVNLLEGSIKQLEEMNWFVRKSNGLLYYYKYKPSVENNQNMFFPSLIVTPVKGDKGKLFGEKDDTFSFIPKNVLIYRNDLVKYKHKD